MQEMQKTLSMKRNRKVRFPDVSKSELESWTESAKVHAHDPYNEREE